MSGRGGGAQNAIHSPYTSSHASNLRTFSSSRVALVCSPFKVTFTDSHVFLESLLNWKGLFEGKDLKPRWEAISELADMIECHEFPGLGLDHFAHLADIHAFAELLQERNSDVREVTKAAEEQMNKYAKSKRAIDKLAERRFQYPGLEEFDSE
jgi:hypothetical protein